MKRVAWIGHYVEETDVFRYNNFSIKLPLARRIFTYFNRRREPYVFTKFVSKKDQIEFYGITWPKFAPEIVSLSRRERISLMAKAMAICDTLKIDQIGIAAMFASIWEDGAELKGMTSIPITTGKNLIASLVVDYIDRATLAIGRRTDSLVLGIVGYKNRLAKVVFDHYVGKVRSIVTDDVDDRLASYTSVKKVTHEEMFKTSDVIVITNMGLGLDQYIPLLKVKAIVCDTIIPFCLTRLIAKQRSDIIAFEGIWSQFEQLKNFHGSMMAELFPHQVVPACLAEPLILAKENAVSSFSLGNGINYSKMQEIDRLRGRNGVSFFGFKNNKNIYYPEDIKKIPDGHKK